MVAYANWTSQPQLVAPAATDQALITPNGSAWVNSNYTVVFSGVARSILITGLSINPRDTGLWRIDLATGTPGNEVVIGTFGDFVETEAGRDHHVISPPIYVATPSVAISARLRKQGTSTTDWGIKISYYALDPFGVIDFTATADFAVVPNIVHNGVVNLTVTADFSVTGIVIPIGPGGGGTPTSLPVIGTFYLRKRRF